ncbi:MAG: type II toxin-antitoxin system CcdA family antitoxin [Acidimicrobiales bacterium]|jgi:post-segregation antitoxin (ccd killing protein)
MARVNIYLPDDLAEEARSAGLNVSKVAQEALRRELANRATSAWVESVERLPPLHPAVAHAAVLEAIDAARAEMGEHRGP